MLFYRAALPLSHQTLTFVSGLVRAHRKRLGSVWRKLNPGQQALQVLVYLRKGEPFAEVGAGFAVSTTTCWRYVNKVVELLGGTSDLLKNTGSSAGRGGRWAPPGYDDPNFTDKTKAHLLPKQFGGNGKDFRNIVGSWFVVNNIAMKSVEDQVETQLAGGERFYYQVTPTYVDGGKPTTIHMFAVGDKGSCVDVIIDNVPTATTHPGGRC